MTTVSDQDPKVTKHRTPPHDWQSEDFGYLKAESAGATVILPVALDVLDSDFYIERLLEFHRIALGAAA